MPKVSICVPVYNVEQYIERCILSLQNQTMKDIEIIVVNDCTPDKSIDLLKKLAREDPRIRIIEHDKNCGLMQARRTGYMAAVGDYITFCDSDDFLPDNAIELLYNEIERTGADVVSGNLMYMKVNGMSELWRSQLNYGYDKHGVTKSLLLGEFRHNLCSKLFSRKILQNYPYQTFNNFTNGEDGCLFYQIVKNIKVIVQIEEPVYCYLQNTASSSQTIYSESALHSICILNRFRHELANLFPDLNKECHKFITSVIYSLYAEGYEYGTMLNSFLAEQKLGKFKVLSLKYFTIIDIIYLLIERYVIGPIRYVILLYIK